MAGVMSEALIARGIAAIDYWQDRAYVHPLTCGVKSSHAELRGKCDKDGEVVLVCPTCGHVQQWIPEHVYSLYDRREKYEEAYSMLLESSRRDGEEG